MYRNKLKKEEIRSMKYDMDHIHRELQKENEIIKNFKKVMSAKLSELDSIAMKSNKTF